jgi:tetratricopeptide (TPR) repeat protein
LVSDDHRHESVRNDEAIDAELGRRIAEFKRSPGLFEAADLVGAAIVLGREMSAEVREAARIVYESSLPVARELSERILLQSSQHEDEPGNLPSGVDLDFERSYENDRSRISQLRRIVSRYPRSALQWTDLALAHTTLGNSRAAEKAIKVALDLTPGNRTVLRAAARFYVHEHDPAKARAVLSTDEDRLRADPWLLAADIAIADLANDSPKHIRRARNLLEADIAPRHLSELAAALATIELAGGRRRQARKLFANALQDPTDNSLAQAEWAVPLGVDIPAVQANPPLNFEAETRHLLREARFDEAVVQARLWLKDQPFSLQPAIHVSYIASALTEDYRTAIEACRKGLRSNAGDPMLMNNLAFSQASAGLVEDAISTFSGINFGEDANGHLIWLATKGLVAFRSGSIDEGRALYEESVRGWQAQDGQADSAARAAIFWAKEEILAVTDHVPVAMRVMDVLFNRSSKDIELRALYGRVRDLRKSPDN